MKDWAVILGASSGFGAAACRELATHGVNIYGIHLDRKTTMDSVNSLVDDLKGENVDVYFKNMNATDDEKRKLVIDELKSFGNIHVKVLMHSLAFGTLKPVIDGLVENTIQQRQIEMTLDVMASSIIYWTQDLFQGGLLRGGSQIFAMTSSGGHRHRHRRFGRHRLCRVQVTGRAAARQSRESGRGRHPGDHGARRLWRSRAHRLRARLHRTQATDQHLFAGIRQSPCAAIRRGRAGQEGRCGYPA